MSHTFGPAFRTPFTDLTASVMTNQAGMKCQDFEMRAVDCIEAYGMAKGQSKCKDYFEDLRECMFESKQLARVQAMRIERHRQWVMGERSSADHYAPGARVDGF